MGPDPARPPGAGSRPPSSPSRFRAKKYTRSHKNENPLENATENPLEDFRGNPLDK